MAAKSECAMKHPNWPLRRLRSEADLLPDKLPPIRLRHGQVLWLLTELGYRGTVSKGTFYEYIKSIAQTGNSLRA
jgi:hypothetical protein